MCVIKRDNNLYKTEMNTKIYMEYNRDDWKLKFSKEQ